MDQESFRKLLRTSQPGSSSSLPKSRGSLLSSTVKLTPVVGPSQLAFKPRKVKLVQKDKELGYRDRASERRLGGGNDYAHIEALLEDFEQQRAGDEDKAAIEEQRRYLGGDGDHSILVKGLDFALLEQNKARAVLSTEDDESLEKTFLEVSSAPPPKKKTREELIRQLKEMKAKGNPVAINGETGKTDEGVSTAEDAKTSGKFKPIGFKPISAPAGNKPRRTIKDKGADGAMRTKKRKLGGKEDEKNGEDKPDARHEREEGKSSSTQLQAKAPLAPNPVIVENEPEPTDDTFDIFAGAGEYEGVDLGDDSDDEDSTSKPPREGDSGIEQAAGSVNWFATDQTKTPPPDPPEPPETNIPTPLAEPPAEEEDVQPVRLKPLESSAVPSIRDLLAIDDATEAEEKRKKRKDKRKRGQGEGEPKKLSAEAKVDRDFKRLKSYTERKQDQR